jgi:lysophospholipid acyltransferase (LPLAT)-like uncharacterized protein
MNKTFSLKQRIVLFIAGLIGPAIINLLGFTWKVKVAGYTDVYPHRGKNNKMIYGFWHNNLLGLCYTQKKKNVGILISSHFDGEIIARIVSRMGYRPLRGSSTRNGASGLLSMLKNEEIWHLAITVDGPRGPKGVVKPGIIYLASKSGLPIVPASCNSSKKWVLSSWDRFEIPKPFAQIVINVGKPIYIDDISDEVQTKKQTEHLAAVLNELGNCS